jgi:arylsulfatase A-like enzyme
VGGPPSIVLISLDTFRADRLGVLGNPDGITPNLDRLAGESTLFTAAHSQATTTGPSHGAVFTGRYPTELFGRGRDIHLDPSRPTLATVLGLYGYQTGAFVGGADLSVEFGLGEGFSTYRAPVDFGSLWHTAPLALSWLDAQPADAPFFLFVHGYDTHSSYLKPDPYGYLFARADYTGTGAVAVKGSTEQVFDGWLYGDLRAPAQLFGAMLRPRSPLGRERLLALDRAQGDQPQPFSEADGAHVRAVYDGAAAYADAQVGLLLAGLQERGVLEEAVVVVMADHGEQLGEQGLYGHCCGAEDAETHVPLLIRLPGGAGGGRRVDAVVELFDLAPTLLELAGATRPAEMKARSLVPTLTTGAPPEDTFALSFGGLGFPFTSARSAAGRLTYAGVPAWLPLAADYVAAARLAGPSFTRSAGLSEADAAPLHDALVARLRGLSPSPQAAPAPMSDDLKQELRSHGYWDVQP